jgi:2-oxoglutarate ferredoxin oxidoreductase subunit delta
MPLPHYRFSFDPGRCMSCGICMDVCPAACLDMSAPEAPGPEPGPALAWMSVYPVQVDRCIGCAYCRTECPTDAITVETTQEEPLYLPHPHAPGAAEPAAVAEDGWIPLSALTRDRHGDAKTNHRFGPWGAERPWTLARRGREAWQSWRSFIPAPAAKARIAK